jgi:coenzyme F420 biosynthesis associated uncharacterized protein
VSSFHRRTAARVAGRLSGSYPLEGTYHHALFERQAPDLVDRSAELASEETGLPWVGDPGVRVVTRREWAEANIGAFTVMLRPVEKKLDEAGRGGLGRRLMSRLVGAEVGALVGLLSRRVLGQYELVLPAGAEGAGDTIMFVGANVLQMERQQEFRPAEFRFWVALHECTHRLQFTAVPWLRPYFLDLVEAMVQESAPEEGRMQRVAAEMREAAREGRPVVDESGLMGLFASADQRRLIDRIQALMSLLEGHGHVVMDRIGSRRLVSQHRMSRVLKARRKDPRMAAFLRLTGLEMKMKQYEWGEAFIHTVERHAGFRTIDRVWEGAEHLPTLDEIRHPERWLERVG